MHLAYAFIRIDLKWRRKKLIWLYLYLADTFFQSDLEQRKQTKIYIHAFSIHAFYPIEQTNKAIKKVYIWTFSWQTNKQTRIYICAFSRNFYTRGNKWTNKHKSLDTFSRNFFPKRLAIEETNKHLHSCISRQLYPIQESNKQTNNKKSLYLYI